jgi:hypothetical protein
VCHCYFGFSFEFELRSSRSCCQCSSSVFSLMRQGCSQFPCPVFVLWVLALGLISRRAQFPCRAWCQARDRLRFPAATIFPAGSTPPARSGVAIRDRATLRFSPTRFTQLGSVEVSSCRCVQSACSRSDFCLIFLSCSVFSFPRQGCAQVPCFGLFCARGATAYFVESNARASNVTRFRLGRRSPILSFSIECG